MQPQPCRKMNMVLKSAGDGDVSIALNVRTGEGQMNSIVSSTRRWNCVGFIALNLKSII